MGGVRQLPSGSFQARVQVHGQAWAQTFSTADEAREWLLLLEASRIDGTLRPRISVTAFADLWVATLPQQARASRSNDLRSLVLPVLGALPVAGVVPTDVRLSMIAIGQQACDRCFDRAMETLEALFGAAHDYGLITRSPVDAAVGTSRATRHHPEARVAASSREAAATIDAALGHLV